jgi:hypothetical protein
LLYVGLRSATGALKGLGRSTAFIRRIDMSAIGQRASAAPANPVSEDALFRGYGGLEPGQTGMVKVCVGETPCVCGGTLYLRKGEDIELSVIRHNATTVHQAYRAWRAARDAA